MGKYIFGMYSSWTLSVVWEHNPAKERRAGKEPISEHAQICAKGMTVLYGPKSSTEAVYRPVPDPGAYSEYATHVGTWLWNRPLRP